MVRENLACPLSNVTFVLWYYVVEFFARLRDHTHQTKLRFLMVNWAYKHCSYAGLYSIGVVLNETAAKFNFTKEIQMT